MKIVVKLFHEIIIKSRPVRKLITKQLHYNLENLLKAQVPETKVYRRWDHIEIKLPNDLPADTQFNIKEKIACIPGIDFFLVVDEVEFESFDDLVAQGVQRFSDQIIDKTFCVRAKRKGKHSFTSIELERELGHHLLTVGQSNGVRLRSPDIELRLEVDGTKAFFIKEKIAGLGGYPIGQQESVVSLISGGYDSGVASFQMIKRGVKTHFCFFNLGGSAHEIGVKQVAYFLWNKYAASHKVKFISVPFEPVVEEILKSMEPAVMGVALKRMMFRAAESLASELAIETLITGEAIGQVSSQTITNLKLIDSATNAMVLRPLVAMDKQDIIAQAKRIGTEEFAANMPEYCGVISQRPSTKVKAAAIEKAEESFDFSVLDNAINNRVVQSIEKVLDGVDTDTQVACVEIPALSDVVIDIRHPEEQEQNPLHLTNNQIIKIPFYSLSKRFPDLDQSNNYLLFCDKGVMSKVQAHHLNLGGFNNVKVLQLP
ncbi:tRNA uracil 4-sulfurtransferase ThiI [Pleionea litopenaei]|uniref:tRNA sulfurtransferase n=1 Tax=Pleionea litopenaei TaxID=3070815 RepID=A0AA51RV96_9GAMM|nr:tRNA uracil 4-sulfurtransferase ThiI [Pleionea sp. HL-JVS1]WMS88386.1 tRNA uracil 4-sulfurtransferase ThiI [Pleionea sp. HL-JVS1]